MAKLRMLPARLSTFDTRTVKPPPKTADPFYLTPEWRGLCATLLEERGKVCEDPDCPRPHPPITRIFHDHVVEKQDGGALLDPANIMQRCGSSHSRKTAKERARRAGIAPPQT